MSERLDASSRHPRLRSGGKAATYHPYTRHPTIVNSDATRRSNNTQQQTAVSRGTTRNGLLPVPTTERGGALFCSACIAPRAGETQHQSILPMSLCGEHYERTCQISSACGQGASFLPNLDYCKIYRTREYDVPSECCLLQLRNSGESHS